MEISNQQIENALYRFLFDKLSKDPAFFKQMVDDVMEDYYFGKLLEQSANDPENDTVPFEEIMAALKHED